MMISVTGGQNYIGESSSVLFWLIYYYTFIITSPYIIIFIFLLLLKQVQYSLWCSSFGEPLSFFLKVLFCFDIITLFSLYDDQKKYMCDDESDTQWGFYFYLLIFFNIVYSFLYYYYFSLISFRYGMRSLCYNNKGFKIKLLFLFSLGLLSTLSPLLLVSLPSLVASSPHKLPCKQTLFR